MTEKPKAYIVRMSAKGTDVPIDADEVQKVIDGILNGLPIKVRRGIINPSFYVGIIEDVERISGYMQELNDIIAVNKQHENLGIGQKKELPKFTLLADIFSGLKLGSGIKQLEN